MTGFERMTVSAPTAVKIIVAVLALAGAYYGGLQTADTKMRQIASETVAAAVPAGDDRVRQIAMEVAAQKQEVVDSRLNLIQEVVDTRLSAIEEHQREMGRKVDRILDVVMRSPSRASRRTSDGADL